MSSNSILWVTTIIMLAGGLLILASGKRRTQAEGLHTVLHGIVPIIAACSYLAMATGQGVLSLPTDAAVAAGQATPTRLFYFARYIDWAFTTPLLLLSLGLTAMRHGPKRHGALVGAVLSDVMMIVTAFAFGASLTDWTKWTWFIVSCVAFLGVYYVIWKPQMEANAAQRDDVQATYRRNASILSVVWLVYPVILAVAPDGLNVISDATSVLVIAVVDVIAKVIYGLMSVLSDTKATDRDLAEGEPELNRLSRHAA
jgi:bacteriorhodopsin